MVLPVHLDGPQRSVVARRGSGLPRKWFPKVTITIHQPRGIDMPQAPRGEGSPATGQRRDAAHHASGAGAIAEDRVDSGNAARAIKLFGRDRKIAEDIRGKEETYGQISACHAGPGSADVQVDARGRAGRRADADHHHRRGSHAGVMAMRRVPAMLNYTSGRQGMENACRLAQVGTIFTFACVCREGEVDGDAGTVRCGEGAYLEDLRPALQVVDKLWLILFALRFPGAAIRHAVPDETAVIYSRRVPKGNRRRGAESPSILSNCYQMRAVIDIGCNDKFLTRLPLFHSFGLGVGTILPLITDAGFSSIHRRCTIA